MSSKLADQKLTSSQTYYPEGAYRTPPQPIHSTPMQTRSGRSVGTPMTSSPSSRLSQSPRGKRKKGAKDKKLECKLSDPLSILTKDYDIPVQDMMAWSKRPNEERYLEVKAKHKGKIPRPMNSFMLYRAAYKDRIRKLGAQGDNNQLISSVAGDSWGMEGPEIKHYYAEIAILEKENHAKAFPEYKFSPNKNARKRDRDDEDEDSDPEWDGGSMYSGKRRRGRNDRDVTRSRSTTPAQLVYGSPAYHPSSYQASNPHLMPVSQYEPCVQPMPYSQYCYEQVAYPQQSHGLQYGPTSVPAHQEQYMSPLVGLPPTNHEVIEGSNGPQPEFGIDPTLGDFASSASYQYGAYPEEHRDHEVRRSRQSYGEGAEVVVHPGMQTLAPAESTWSPNAFDAELSRWHGAQQ